MHSLYATDDKISLAKSLTEYTDIFTELPITAEQILLLRVGGKYGRRCAVVVNSQEAQQLPPVVINNVQKAK